MYYVYEDFIEPNGLANNSVFLRYELVPLLLNAVGNTNIYKNFSIDVMVMNSFTVLYRH